VRHVEHRVVGRRLHGALGPDAAARQVRRQAAAGHGHLVKASGSSIQSVSPFRKASQVGCFSSMTAISTRSIIGSRRPCSRARMAWPSASSAPARRRSALAVARVAFEHDARGAAPLGQAERTGAHRVLHAQLALRLDHLARHRGGGASASHCGKRGRPASSLKRSVWRSSTCRPSIGRS
jgi:hypothetical protein